MSARSLSEHRLRGVSEDQSRYHWEFAHMPRFNRFVAGLLLLAVSACRSEEDESSAGENLATGSTGSGGAASTTGGSNSGGALSSGGHGTGGTEPLGTGGDGAGGTGNTGAGGEGNDPGIGGVGNVPATGGAGNVSGLGGSGAGPVSGSGGDGPPTGGAGVGGAGTGGVGNAAGTGTAGASGTGNAAGTGGAGNDTGTGGTGNEAGSGGSAGHVRDPNLPTYPFSDPGALYPFPQMVDYPHGVQSANIDHEFVADWYTNWKSRYLKDCNGMILPSTDNASTAKVEAQGFGMLAAAYMADKTTLDGLYAFYQSKLQGSSCGLMAWICNCGGIQDGGAATDGDIDVASALVVAHWQWPDDGYDEKARTVINNLRGVLTDCSGNLTALHPGCSGGRPWGGCDETDISYYSPAFFRYFAEISGDDIWAKLADDTQTIRDNAANSSTGLVPDWQSVDGRAGAGSRSGSYGFDAIRAPFKQALDYLWNGTEPARAWCEKISSWAYGVGVSNLVDGYQLNGSPAGRNHNLAVVGSLAVCASANSQEVVDAFVAESARLRDDFWYSGYLGNLYLLAMSGNMWHRDMMAD